MQKCVKHDILSEEFNQIQYHNSSLFMNLYTKYIHKIGTG